MMQCAWAAHSARLQCSLMLQLARGACYKYLCDMLDTSVLLHILFVCVCVCVCVFVCMYVAGVRGSGDLIAYVRTHTA